MKQMENRIFLLKYLNWFNTKISEILEFIPFILLFFWKQKRKCNNTSILILIFLFLKYGWNWKSEIWPMKLIYVNL